MATLSLYDVTFLWNTKFISANSCRSFTHNWLGKWPGNHGMCWIVNWVSHCHDSPLFHGTKYNRAKLSCNFNWLSGCLYLKYLIICNVSFSMLPQWFTCRTEYLLGLVHSYAISCVRLLCRNGNHYAKFSLPCSFSWMHPKAVLLPSERENDFALEMVFIPILKRNSSEYLLTKRSRFPFRAVWMNPNTLSNVPCRYRQFWVPLTGSRIHCGEKGEAIEKRLCVVTPWGAR